VADGYRGLSIIDITNPANQTLFALSSYDIARYAQKVTLSGDGTKAYVADSGSGLVIIDITDPENLILLGSYDTAGNASDVALSDDGTKA